MTVSQKQLFLDLETLTEEQIEAGLRAGVWGDPARSTVERHLDQLKLARVEAAAAEQLAEARDAITEAEKALDQANTVKTLAISALIISAGAMLAAMASAFVAFLALRQWTLP